MKKLALLLASAIAVFSCSREMEVEIPEPVQNNDPSAWVVRFSATQTDTKAQFGEAENGAYPTLWTDNDTEVKLSLNYGGVKGAAVTPAGDKRTASFAATFDFTGLTAPYVFYSVSPSSAAKALSPSREAWKVTIPCTQNPTATSVDEAGIILAATSDAFGEVTDISEVNLYFNHLTAYGRLSLANLALESGETVSGVELTVTTPIVGDWYWNTSGSTITDYGASSTLTINTTRTSDIWFACAPVDVSGEMMTVTVFTSLGYHEQLVEFPAGRRFEAGRTAVFSVDMAGADFTAAGSGSGGGDVVVLSEEFDNGTTSDSSTEFGSSKFPNFSGSTSKAYTSQFGGVKLGSSSASGYITSKSLDLSSGFTVTLNVLRYNTDSGKVQVTVGDVTKEITPTTTDTAYSLDFDAATSASTVRIATSTKRAYIDNVIITRHDGGSGAAGPDPLLQESAYGCYLGTGLEWEYNPGAEQVTRSYDTNGVQTYTLIDPAEVEELEIVGYKKSYVKGDSFTVSVQWRKGISTIHSESYNVTLIKEEGPKVWLSDGTHGVIIKK